MTQCDLLDPGVPEATATLDCGLYESVTPFVSKPVLDGFSLTRHWKGPRRHSLAHVR